MKGGALSSNACAAMMYAIDDIFADGFFTCFLISSSDLAIYVLDMGIPVRSSMGKTCPINWLVELSYSILGKIPVPSSDSQTALGNLNSVKNLLSSSARIAPSVISGLNF